ncbi:DUF4013 domain-containing protein [uncultured Methanobrevibacter sp.]|uniref:DUF4013 domain-containing protein n=1 Tax=uncultured Methanobrevibacter sp. TaxID=253161 RepID=UPI002615230E|nr:DUF4013 domain-containing protein [uncultured Methanobrevibacter sp.]
MKLFVGYIGNAVRYALSDRKGIIVISTLMAITSIATANHHLNSFWRMLTVTLLIVMGYGSYVSWYTLKGSDEHPKITNLKKLTWEGFKKSAITFIYSIGLTFFFHQAKVNLNGKIILSVIFITLFALTYLCLIAGLLNRYLHKGKFIEAFNLREIWALVTLFDIRSFLRVIGAVILSQAFAISVVVGFSDGFDLIELLKSLSTFFLAPFFYIAAKRFVGLNVRELLKNTSK